jgi:hypothetical protein
MAEPGHEPRQERGLAHSGGTHFHVRNQRHRGVAALQRVPHCYRLPLLISAHDRLCAVA